MASTQVCVRLALSEVSLAKTVARGSLIVLRPLQASKLLPTFAFPSPYFSSNLLAFILHAIE
jgi:hypothetical protein